MLIAAYQSMRLEETKTIWPFWRLYLFSVKTNWQKKTVGDLGWHRMNFSSSSLPPIANYPSQAQINERLSSTNRALTTGHLNDQLSSLLLHSKPYTYSFQTIACVLRPMTSDLWPLTFIGVRRAPKPPTICGLEAAVSEAAPVEQRCITGTG